jgi:hypothetical protein
VESKRNVTQPYQDQEGASEHSRTRLLPPRPPGRAAPGVAVALKHLMNALLNNLNSLVMNLRLVPLHFKLQLQPPGIGTCMEANVLYWCDPEALS